LGEAVVISTWNFGLKANQEAWKVIENNGKVLDAVESGIRVIESDPKNHSVGLGGYPDRDGHVTLDACIMDPEGKAGSVSFLEGIQNPISVARKIMEETPHVMLSGKGALNFAMEKGFQQTELLTEESKRAWEEWMKKENYHPVINIENHDTIGLLCLDNQGEMAGGCSTSGLAYKLHGRVGDSPIIGAALFVDNEIGAAVTTGLGEMVMRSLSSFLVVELMRNGASPQDACIEAIHRISNKNPEYTNSQVGILALSKSGEIGAYAIQPGFNYAYSTRGNHKLLDSDSLIK
jgi:isoaspartyl peptidase/L-asparaginase-like protein (Ntn-hydrolase superfamily)